MEKWILFTGDDNVKHTIIKNWLWVVSKRMLLGTPAPQRAWSGWTFPSSQLSVVSEEAQVRKGQNAVFGKHHKNLLCHWFWNGQSVQVHKLTQFTQLVHIPRREGHLLGASADRWQLGSEFEKNLQLGLSTSSEPLTESSCQTWHWWWAWRSCRRLWWSWSGGRWNRTSSSSDI